MGLSSRATDLKEPGPYGTPTGTHENAATVIITVPRYRGTRNAQPGRRRVERLCAIVSLSLYFWMSIQDIQAALPTALSARRRERSLGRLNDDLKTVKPSLCKKNAAFKIAESIRRSYHAPTRAISPKHKGVATSTALSSDIQV